MIKSVKVSEYLADWYEKEDLHNRSLYTVLKLAREVKREDNVHFYMWYNTQSFKSTQETLAKMWLYGYEVEEERFYWRKKEYSVFSFESIDDQYLNVIDNSDGGKTMFFGNNAAYRDYKTKLTRQEVFSLLPVRDIAQLERIKVED